jgi:hypothetical protein
MNIRNIRNLLVVLGMALGLPAASWASFPVLITQLPGGGFQADGDIGTAHNQSKSIPGNQSYISCSIDGTRGYCVFRDASGLLANCSTSDANLMANIRAINVLSHVRVTAPVLTFGTCSNITVYQESSTELPIAP